MNKLKKGDLIRPLLCGHTFHSKCIDEWLMNKA